MSLLVVAACATVSLTALVALPAYLLVVPVVRTLRSGAAGAALVPVLAGTGVFQLAWSLLLAVGIGVAALL